MKKLILLFVMAFVASAASYVFAGSDGKASIKFSETTHNFGVIEEANGPVSYEFEFTNTGNANLIITDARAQCGCTRPEFPKKAIAPGKKGVVKVTYNPSGRPGSFDKKVTIVSNGSPSKTYLKIKGNVVGK